MSKSAFPDLLGPSRASANGGASVVVRRLNFLGLNVLSQPRTIDVSAEVLTATVNYAAIYSGALVGDGVSSATVIRLVSAFTLELFGVGTDPAIGTKYLVNVSGGVLNLTAQTPPQPGGFAQSRTITGVGIVAKVVWDSVARLWLVRSGYNPMSDLTLSGARLTISGAPLTLV